MLFPGSGLFNRGSDWVVAAEMVETTRLFARTAAHIESEWVESLAGDLCRRTYSDPHWERKRGEVVALEQVTLYGLPVVVARPVSALMGQTIFQTSLDFAFNTTAVFIWLLAVLAIAFLASLIPAHAAGRISVRESLAYA